MSEIYKVVKGKVLVDDDMISRLVEDGHVEKYTRIVNSSCKPIWMCSVDGSITMVKPSIRNPYRESIIIVHRLCPHNGEIEWLDGVENSAMQSIMQSQIRSGMIEWEEEIPIDEIINHKNGVYITSSDVVVTSDPYVAKKLHHPRCMQKIHNDYINANTAFDPDSMLNVIIRMIDNSGLLGGMFTVFHNQVVKLTPIQDPNQEDGIYVTGLIEVDAHGIRTMRKDVHYPFSIVNDGKAPIKLYSSVREANEAKDSRLLKELELADAEAKRKHDKEIVEMKREHEKLHYEKEQELKEMEKLLREREAVMQELKAMRDNDYHSMKHRRNIESEEHGLELSRVKHRHDTTSTNNKMMVETIKTVGLVASGMLMMKTIMGK